MFKEYEFPRTISYKALGGPGFNTTVNSGFSGFEQRNQNWQVSRGEWTVSLETPGANENVNPQLYIEQLTAFFLNVGGKANAFRLKDHKDFTNGLSPQVIGVGDGVTSNRILVKNYSVAGDTYQRIISKPITSLVLDYLGNALLDTVDIKIAGVSQPKQAGYKMGGASKYSLDHTTGQVSFGSATKMTMQKYDAVNVSGVLYYRFYYSAIVGPAPLVNQQVFCLTSTLYGTFNIVATGPNWFAISQTNPNSYASTFTGESFIGWSWLKITTVTTPGGGYTTWTYQVVAGYGNVDPVAGQRINIFDMQNSGNNGSRYIVDVDTVAKTFRTIAAGGDVAESGSNGVGTTDFCPSGGAGTITATFQYHMPVRFDTDNLAIQLEESDVQGGHPIVTWNAITLREVRIQAGQSQG